jgi:uncharacterized membrane protein
MPPIHPALVHFPIALMIFAFVADLIAHFRPSPSWRIVGLVALSGAVVGGAGAVAAGYYDMGRASLGETHEYVHLHMTVGWILLGFILGLTLWRWQISRQSEPRIGLLYVIAALLTLGITLFQGWYGGELVFSQGAGVAAAGKGTESPSDGYQRLSNVTRHLAGLVSENARHEENEQ